MSTLIDKSAPIRRATGLLLASDGFSGAFGTTDGTGSNVPGGGGLTWTASLGTWSTSGGVASVTAVTGGVAVATVDVSRANVIVAAWLYRSGNTAGIVCRYVDANNHIQARHTGTNVQFVKVIAGTPTTLIDTAVTYVAGAEMQIACNGTSFRVFYNGTAVSTEQTIADAAVASATKHGLRSTDTSNTFDNFTVFAL